MSKNLSITMSVLVVAGAAGLVGNWWGAHHAAGTSAGMETSTAMSASPAAKIGRASCRERVSSPV